MIYNGLLSLFFYLFYFGSFVSLILTKTEEKNYFSNILTISILSSLYLSWFLVFFKIVFNFKINLFYLYSIITFINLYLIYKTKKSSNYILDFKDIIFFFLFVIIFTSFIRSPDYDFTFAYGDAVVSWNRWAIEIFQNNFDDLFGYYPIFWPGIWSLIYEAQEDASFWIITKGSVLIIPFIYFLISFRFLQNKKYFEFSFFVFIFFQIFFQYPFKVYLFSGYMDNPVSLLSIILFMLIIDNIFSSNKKNTKHYLIFSFLAGIISITKFSGMLTLLLYNCFLIYSYKIKVIKKKFLNLNLFISIIPSLTFFLIYLIVQDFNLSKNNIGNLIDYSLLINNNILLAAFLRIFQIINPFLLFLMISLAIFNFFKKDKTSLVGKYFFIIFILGILIYSTVSYDVRNSFYLIFFLIVSCYCSLKKIDFNKNLIRNKHIKNNFLLIILCLFVLFSFITDKFLSNFLIVKDNEKIKNMHPITIDQLKDFKDLNNLINKK